MNLENCPTFLHLIITSSILISIIYLIAILKEIDALNQVDFPYRNVLILLAEHEKITDNRAVKRLIRKYDFLSAVTIKNAQHEIMIEKKEIKSEALSVIHSFIK